jgi:hypothetical protein
MHHFYHVESVTDLAVMREQANARTRPDNKYGGFEAEESVIHMHRRAVPCRGVQHEFYPVAPDTATTLASRFWNTIPKKETGK